MREFFKAAGANTVGTIAGGIMLIIGGSVYALVKGAHVDLVGIAFVILGIVITGVFLLRWRRSLKRIGPSTIEFYSSRSVLNETRGGLTKELQSLSDGWVSWTTFASVLSIDASLLKNVSRMVLRHPDSPDLEQIAKVQQVPMEHIKSMINQAVTVVRKHGVPIYLAKFPVPDITIHNPRGNDAWVRVETFLPGVPAGKRPSFIVRRSEYQDLFEAIKFAYEQMWNELITESQRSSGDASKAAHQ